VPSSTSSAWGGQYDGPQVSTQSPVAVFSVRPSNANALDDPAPHPANATEVIEKRPAAVDPAKGAACHLYSALAQQFAGLLADQVFDSVAALPVPGAFAALQREVAHCGDFGVLLRAPSSSAQPGASHPAKASGRVTLLSIGMDATIRN
jgi:hypothetical protein